MFLYYSLPLFLFAAFYAQPYQVDYGQEQQRPQEPTGHFYHLVHIGFRIPCTEWKFLQRCIQLVFIW